MYYRSTRNILAEMMENSSDIEDIIPPTPQIQLNKVCSHIDKTSITASKLSRKIFKNDPNGFKRKRIISPDYKKVKQKVKQVTLYNFLVKPNKNPDLNPTANTSSDVVSSVNVNLLNKFEETEVKNYEAIPETATVNADKSSCTSEKQISSPVSECVKEMCKEVASLELVSSQSKETPCVLAVNENLDCDNAKLGSDREIHEMHIEEVPKDMDQTFSWMTDLLLERDKDNFDFSYNFSDHDTSGDCCKHPEEESYIKFKVRELQKYPTKNEIRLVVAAKHNSKVVKTCYLRGFWTDSIVSIGDTVNILNPSKTEKTVIDNDTGFLVVNPDFLISSTAVVSTLFCMRKAVLNHILPQWSPGNNIMMIGSLVHDIFQKNNQKLGGCILQ